MVVVKTDCPIKYILKKPDLVESGNT
ncbi:hypothetical protein A2U01_0050751, partial [Trifolium medium]|nr:hypothetical protein [Trifolium medium]